MDRYDAVVIGAGNGGLVAAIRLLQGGAKVLLVEKHNIPGGFATSFRRGRFEFEASLHELNDFGAAGNGGDVRDETFDIVANSCETVLTAMERAGINAPSKCRAGGCGYCHSRLIDGKYSIAGADKRRLADAKFCFIHPCCTYPDTDMEIEVPAEV